MHISAGTPSRIWRLHLRLPSPVSQHGESIFYPPLFFLPSAIRLRFPLRSFRSLSTLLQLWGPRCSRPLCSFILSPLFQHRHKTSPRPASARKEQPLILVPSWSLLGLAAYNSSLIQRLTLLLDLALPVLSTSIKTRYTVREPSRWSPLTFELARPTLY